MSVLSDKLQDVFMNIHNKFVDVNSRTDELFDAKADKSDTYTKTEVDDKIANSGGSITVDQTYDAESENAQSGTAVAEAVDNKVDKRDGAGLVYFSPQTNGGTSIVIHLPDKYPDFEALTVYDTDEVNSKISSVSNMAENADSKATLVASEYTFVQQQLTNIEANKSDKPSVFAYPGVQEVPFEFSAFYNTIVRADEVASLSFTFGDGAYQDDYTSDLSFDSGETPTAIDYTDSGILNWVGTDCVTSNGLSIFQPSPNTHYDIVFYFNGVQFIGLVNGFVPATGNVVSE